MTIYGYRACVVVAVKGTTSRLGLKLGTPLLGVMIMIMLMLMLMLMLRVRVRVCFKVSVSVLDGTV